MVLGSLIIDTPIFKVYCLVLESCPPQYSYTAFVNGEKTNMTYNDIWQECIRLGIRLGPLL